MNARDELAELLEEEQESGRWASSPTADLYGFMADAILAAGYRKTDPAWAETLINDGIHEFTITSDCDGSNVKHWRRIPGLTYEGQASPWTTYTPEPTA